MKAGKPVLACFGPVNESPDRQAPPDLAGPDRLEDLLAQLGVKLGKQTVLFDAESESFAERRSNQLLGGANVDIPKLDFDWKAGAGRPLGRAVSTEDEAPNPIRESMRL